MSPGDSPFGIEKLTVLFSLMNKNLPCVLDDSFDGSAGSEAVPVMNQSGVFSVGHHKFT